MHNDQAISESGISFDVTPRPTLGKETVVATFVDGNSERHKVELSGIDLTKVTEQLLQNVKGENIPFMNKAHLYVNPANPIYLRVFQRGTDQLFTPPSTVSPFASHSTYTPSF